MAKRNWLAFFNEEFGSIYEIDAAYNDFSIFRKRITHDMGIYSMTTNFSGSPHKDNHLLNKAIGCIMGHVIGDSMGSVLEFRELSYQRNLIHDYHPYYFSYHNPSSDVVNAFRLKIGQFTDDFSMAMCLADSLLINSELDCIDLRIRFLRWWHSGYNNTFRFDKFRKIKTSVGLGGNISESFIEAVESKKIEPFTKAGNSHTSGNGSIMRLSPVSLFYHNNMEKAIEAAEKQSLTTHQGIEAADCSKILSYILVKAINLPPSKEPASSFLDSLDISGIVPHLKTHGGKCLIESRVEDDIKLGPYCQGPEDRDWNWKAPNYKFSPTRTSQNPRYIGSYAMDALAMSLHCVYSTKGFTEAVIKAINLGGDSDSLGAVTGQLAGAIYGIVKIPPLWSHYVMKWDNKGEIPLRAICCIFPKIRARVIDLNAVVRRQKE